MASEVVDGHWCADVRRCRGGGAVVSMTIDHAIRVFSIGEQSVYSHAYGPASSSY
jgi:hypothetical protein